MIITFTVYDMSETFLRIGLYCGSHGGQVEECSVSMATTQKFDFFCTCLVKQRIFYQH